MRGMERLRIPSSARTFFNQCYTYLMETKQLIWIGMVVGSAVGGYLPLLWGSSLFSFSSIVLTAVGGIAGIWAGYKLGNW